MGMATSIGQYAPVLLPGEPPSLTEKPGKPQSTGLQRVRHYQCDPARIDTRLFACDSSAPVRVEREGGAAAWLAGTLVVPILQGPGLSLPQELWLYQYFFFEPLVAGDQKTSLASLSGALPIQALRGLPCLGFFSVVGCISHIEEPPW